MSGSEDGIRHELSRLAEHLRRFLASVEDIPSISPSELRSCQIAEESAELAAVYQEQLHYLSSPRADGIHLGLRTGGHLPACLLSFGPFDLEHLTPLLPFGIKAEQVLVLTRQVTVGDVPRNTWSFTFGRACRWLRVNRSEVRMVMTYLDTNVGFCGSCYLAANWYLFGAEKKDRYVFVDGIPVTNRQLVSRFGTAPSTT